MRWLFSLVFVLVTLSSPALAQQSAPCGIGGQTKIFGCMDRINGAISTARPVLDGGQDIAIHGWTLSQWSLQQPAEVRIGYAGPRDATGQRPLLWLAPTDYTIHWRGHRPDVAAYFRRLMPITSELWGYVVVIHPDVLPPGETVLVVSFSDPAIGIGINFQQAMITIQ